MEIPRMWPLAPAPKVGRSADGQTQRPLFPQKICRTSAAHFLPVVLLLHRGINGEICHASERASERRGKEREAVASWKLLSLRRFSAGSSKVPHISLTHKGVPKMQYSFYENQSAVGRCLETVNLREHRMFIVPKVAALKKAFLLPSIAAKDVEESCQKGARALLLLR